MARKFLICTGTRAEYGLLRGTMLALRAQGADARWLVTGAHLSTRHGFTADIVRGDGFPIAAEVPMPLEDDSPQALTAAMGVELAGMAGALAQWRPDVVVVLGDRYEMLICALASAMTHIPIAHLHGGEVTEGALDESFRHAITKLSTWHFASAPAYARRLCQLGEDPAHVFTVGAAGVDNLTMPLLSRSELEAALGISLADPVALFTFHPETLSTHAVEAQVACVTMALRQLPELAWIITGANADSGGVLLNKALGELAAQLPRAYYTLSLGQQRYLSAMRVAQVVAGNSSSGVIEAPAMGRATVNIGTRQAGRMQAPSVVSCELTPEAIVAAMRRALSPAFQQALTPCDWFGIPGQVAPRIARELLALPLPPPPCKKFHDII